MSFNLEKRYQKYLDLMQLDESKMHETQRQETRRAFFGGLTMAFQIIGYEIPELPDATAYKAITQFEVDLQNYWAQTIDPNKFRNN